jgi:hypothetical protein
LKGARHLALAGIRLLGGKQVELRCAAEPVDRPSQCTVAGDLGAAAAGKEVERSGNRGFLRIAERLGQVIPGQAGLRNLGADQGEMVRSECAAVWFGLGNGICALR